MITRAQAPYVTAALLFSWHVHLGDGATSALQGPPHAGLSVDLVPWPLASYALANPSGPRLELRKSQKSGNPEVNHGKTADNRHCLK